MPSRPERLLSWSITWLGVAVQRLLHVRDDRRVDGARARPHHHAVERREPHGRVDALPVVDGRERAAVAEVGGDEGVVGRGEPEQPHRLLRDVAVARAVEPVPPDLVVLEPLVGHRVQVGARRHRRVEGGVEHRHLRQLGEELLGDADAEQVRRVVQRAERDALLDLRDHLLGDRHRAGEARAAVHDAVADPGEIVDEPDAPEQLHDRAQRGVVVGVVQVTAVLVPIELPVQRRMRRVEALRDAGDPLGAVGGVDDCKLRRRAATVQDEDVQRSLRGSGSTNSTSARSPPPVAGERHDADDD